MIRLTRSSLASTVLAAFLQLVLLTGPLWEVSRAAPVLPVRLSMSASPAGVAVEVPDTSHRHDESTCLACVTSSLVARLGSGPPPVRVGVARRISQLATAKRPLLPAGPRTLHSRAPPLTA